jgi:hypothetical protein
MSILSTPKNVSKDVIMACHITGIYDVNRNNLLPSDDYSLVKDWADSITDLKLNGIIFHNNFSEETCLSYQNEHIHFVKIDYDSRFNPNVYRYLVYEEYLQNHSHEIKNLFLTDISDVVVVQNPFLHSFYLQNENTVFCGDESKPLNNEWMQAHSEHLRSKITDYADYEGKFSDSTLLNCGIVGGNVKVMQELIEKLATIHRLYNYDNQSTYTGDMGAFNYLIHTEFNDRFCHGTPINTTFKEYQELRNECWFRHK